MNDQTTRPSVARQRYCCALSAAFLIPILLVPSVAVTEPPENRPQVNSATTYTRYHIPEAERPALEQLALDGSADAAFRLYLNLDLEDAKLEEKTGHGTICWKCFGGPTMTGRALKENRDRAPIRNPKMRPHNTPMKLSVSPQGHRSIIEGPVHAAVPQLVGKPLGGLYR